MSTYPTPLFPHVAFSSFLSSLSQPPHGLLLVRHLLAAACWHEWFPKSGLFLWKLTYQIRWILLPPTHVINGHVTVFLTLLSLSSMHARYTIWLPREWRHY